MEAVASATYAELRFRLRNTHSLAETAAESNGYAAFFLAETHQKGARYIV